MRRGVSRWVVPVAIAVLTFVLPVLGSGVGIGPLEGDRRGGAIELVFVVSVLAAIVLAFAAGVTRGWRAVASLLVVWFIATTVIAALGDPSCRSGFVRSCASQFSSGRSDIATPILIVGGALAVVAAVGRGLFLLKLRMGWHPEREAMSPAEPH